MAGVLKAKVGGVWVPVGVSPVETPSKVFRANAVQSTITPAQGLINVIGLTIPASALPAGRLAIVHINVNVTQSTPGTFDTIMLVNGVGPNHQSNGNAAGTVLNWSAAIAGAGADVSCLVQLYAWGGQSVTLSQNSSIIAVTYAV